MDPCGQTQKKAANMGKPRHRTLSVHTYVSMHTLDEEPDEDEDNGRDLDDLNQQDQWDQCKDTPLGVEDEIGSHDSCNCTRRAHYRDR